MLDNSIGTLFHCLCSYVKDNLISPYRPQYFIICTQRPLDLLCLHHLRFCSCYGREGPCTVYPVRIMAHPEVLFCNSGWRSFSKRYSIHVLKPTKLLLVCEVGLPSIEFCLRLPLMGTAHQWRNSWMRLLSCVRIPTSAQAGDLQYTQASSKKRTETL